MARINICKEKSCKDAATTEGYCRLHYLRNWKQIKREKRRRAAKKLNQYIEGICRRHPDRYMDEIKKDIRSPLFDKYVEETFGYGSEDADVFGGPGYEEEIERLIRKLKIEEGF